MDIYLNADVPEGAIIVREHTAMSNLFSCLWFNEVNLFTPRDQLSFGYVVYRLKGLFEFFMFPNCEYNSLFVLHPHIREHSSRIEWVTNWNQLKGNGTISNKGKDWDQASGKNGNLIESRGGLGLWTPYPGNLDSVALPPVARTSKAGWGSILTFGLLYEHFLRIYTIFPFIISIPVRGLYRMNNRVFGCLNLEWSQKEKQVREIASNFFDTTKKQCWNKM